MGAVSRLALVVPISTLLACADGLQSTSALEPTATESAATAEKVSVVGTPLGISWTPDLSDVLVVSNTNSAAIDVRSASNAGGYLQFSDSNARSQGYIGYGHIDDSLRFGAGGRERARISSEGHLGIGNSGPTDRLDIVETWNNANNQYRTVKVRVTDQASSIDSRLASWSLNNKEHAFVTRRKEGDQYGSFAAGGVIGANGPGNGDFIALAPYEFGMALNFRSSAHRRMEIWGHTGNEWAPILTLGTYDGVNVSEFRNQKDTHALQIRNATGDSFYEILTSGENHDIRVSPNGAGVVDVKKLRIRAGTPPANSSAACGPGDVSWSTDYVYICVATNTWKRSSLTSW